MSASLRRFAIAGAAALLVTGVLAATTQAAPPRFHGRGAVVLPNSAGFVNPNYQIYPGLSVNQYAYNVATLGRAYSNVPPWVYGYNPYPSVVNYGPVYRSYYNPYATSYYNPYLYGYGTYNPYYYNPYYGLYYP
jgi:hypothetical protein